MNSHIRYRALINKYMKARVRDHRLTALLDHLWVQKLWFVKDILIHGLKIVCQFLIDERPMESNFISIKINLKYM